MTEKGYQYAKGKIIAAVREMAENDDTGVDNGGAVRYAKIAKYIPYAKVGAANIDYIRGELNTIYKGVKSGIADGIAIENGNTVYIVDSGKEKGFVGFGVRKKAIVSDKRLRKERILKANDRAISNGNVSEQLLGKIEHTSDNDIGSSIGRELQKELPTDNGKSADNERGISGKDGDRGGNVRFSLKESDAAYLSAVESGDMETAQNMVDEAAKKAGYTVKAYHGTPNGTFTVFRDWSYFTANKKYADIYQNQGAKKTADNPMTYSVYLDPRNIFDTRKAKDRNIFEDEFYRKWGNGAPLSDRGLPDWTDGDDLIEFFEDKGYDYDAFYLDEGTTGEYGNDLQDRGVSIIVKKSSQVKSADPVTYDKDGKVIPLSERFNEQNEDIRFSLKEGDITAATPNGLQARLQANAREGRVYTRENKTK